jgi:hypothetical protein
VAVLGLTEEETRRRLNDRLSGSGG